MHWPSSQLHMEAFYKTANYALVQQSDMPQEMKEEAIDICTQAIEKHAIDLEKATQVKTCQVAVRCTSSSFTSYGERSPSRLCTLTSTQVIKESLDKKFGGPWHVVAGSTFSYEITHEVSSAGSTASTCKHRSMDTTSYDLLGQWSHACCGNAPLHCAHGLLLLPCSAGRCCTCTLVARQGCSHGSCDAIMADIQYDGWDYKWGWTVYRTNTACLVGS